MSDIPLDFFVATVVVVVQIALSHCLLRTLEREHPQVFDRIGSPHMLWNNTPRSTWLFWCWLCSPQASLTSPGVAKLVWAIRLLTIAFLIWFATKLLAIW
jgi:hypothetical protein